MFFIMVCMPFAVSAQKENKDESKPVHIGKKMELTERQLNANQKINVQKTEKVITLPSKMVYIKLSKSEDNVKDINTDNEKPIYMSNKMGVYAKEKKIKPIKK